MSDLTEQKIKELNNLLESHIIGYSWVAWNEERVERGEDPVPIPVPPAPLERIKELAKELGVLGVTKLIPGSLLYRGYGNIKNIDGLSQDKKTLTLDRITSFTPFKEYVKSEYGPIVVCIVLDNICNVFSNTSRCCNTTGCRSDGPCRINLSLVHTGDIGIEVQLMPGTYNVKSVEGLNTAHGGMSNNKVHVLGRDRKVIKYGRVHYVTYKKQLIMLSHARKLERILLKEKRLH